MKKFLIITAAAFILFGCKKDKEITNGVIIQEVVTFSILNDQGADLLDPKVPGHVDTVKIKVFHEENGKAIEYFEPRYDHFQKGWEYNKKLDYNIPENRIAILLNSSEPTNRSVTYVQWTENDSDTIEAVFIKPNGALGSILLDKVWVNNELSWERKGSGGDTPNFTLRK